MASCLKLLNNHNVHYPWGGDVIFAIKLENATLNNLILIQASSVSTFTCIVVARGSGFRSLVFVNGMALSGFDEKMVKRFFVLDG